MFYRIGLSFGIFCAIFCTIFADEAEKEFITALNEIDGEKSIHLFGGLRIDRIEKGRSFPVANSESIEDKVKDYFETHQLRFSYPEEETERMARSEGHAESRTRKLKKLLIPLMIGLKLKLAIIVPLMLLIIKAISLKALAASFLALIFSGVCLIRDMMTKKKDHVTTAYITGAPLNAEIVHTDWNRNGQISSTAAQELAYNYHTIPQGSY